MTVLDLGAHVGYYSRLFSGLVGPKGKVYAFEASPENQTMLRRNLDSPRYANVEVVPRAICDREGTVKLFVSPGHSNHSLIPGFTAAETVLEIPSISVDAFVAQRGIQALDFVKMDIEGAETMALNGMRETIRNSPGLALLVECNLLSLETLVSTPAKFMALIEGLGLWPSAILKDATLGPLPDVADIDLYVNLLCVKPGDCRLGAVMDHP
jgi:FkbM family methyltransferase